MNRVRLLDLGLVSPLRSQTAYHAVAYALAKDTPDTIILVNPNQPYVCIGYHQDPEKEVDLAYCQRRGLPVIRREVGGGAVYLDDGQLFVQWVFHPARLPVDLGERFALYIRPLVETYRGLGIPAYHRPVNDVHVDGRKIGGTGAGQIGGAEVVVGSLMFHFDKVTMARVLKVPSEKMRDKIVEGLAQYMTTMQEQLGYLPDRQVVKELYLQQCARALGAEITPGEWSTAEEAMATQLDVRFSSAEWLRGNTPTTSEGLQTLRQAQGRPSQVSSVRIQEDVRVVEGVFKAPGGLIRATVRLRQDRIEDLALSGDFTLLPTSGLAALEQAARDLTITPHILSLRLEEVYRELNVQSPGLTPKHFAEAIMAACGGQVAPR